MRRWQIDAALLELYGQRSQCPTGRVQGEGMENEIEQRFRDARIMREGQDEY